MNSYSNTFDSDMRMEIHGVPGRLKMRTTKPGEAERGALWTRQVWISEGRSFPGNWGPGARLHAELRYDDECGNGHNDFAITAIISGARYRHDNGSIGCAHDDIAQVFPELAHLIKWHLCSSEGPIHYIANTIHFAGDRDCHGLRKGEKRQIINGRTKQPRWKLEIMNKSGVMISDTPTGQEYKDAETVPLFIVTDKFDGPADELPPVPEMQWVPWCRVGEGKERELESARRAAIWPDATDAQLVQEPDKLRAALEARLPALLAEFREAMTLCGFALSPASWHEARGTL